MTAEDWADRDRTQQLVRERIAYHETKTREQEEEQRKAGRGA
jgi:hypothetical protein